MRDGKFEDAIPVMQALIKAAPNRMVWGTDWPHTGEREPLPEGEETVTVPYGEVDENRCLAVLADALPGRGDVQEDSGRQPGAAVWVLTRPDWINRTRTASASVALWIFRTECTVSRGMKISSAGAGGTAFGADFQFQLAFQHRHQLVRRMDEAVPFLARGIGEAVAGIAAPLPGFRDRTAVHRLREFRPDNHFRHRRPFRLPYGRS